MNPNIVFFGTPEFSTIILDHLHEAGMTPSLIITAPDKLVGRKQVLTPPAVKVWAQQHNVDVWQPNQPQDILEKLTERKPDVGIVAAYGYIMSQELLDVPKHGTLNVHTSLLPRFRGACPIESAILHGDEVTGSTIMLMDEKMDHGHIISQEYLELDSQVNRIELFEDLAHHGGSLLVNTIPRWIKGDIEAQEQEHENATFCYKINKSDGDITNDSDEVRDRKYRAYMGWPGVFFFDENNKRIKVTEAQYADGNFNILKVIPEGKNEMSYEDYLKKSTS
jgi:methionyl-tRNA formyltransferase